MRLTQITAALVQVDFLPDVFPGAKGHSGFLEVRSRLCGSHIYRSIDVLVLHSCMRCEQPPSEHGVSSLCAVHVMPHGYRACSVVSLQMFGCLQQLSSVTDPEAATSEYNLVENINVRLCLNRLPPLLRVSWCSLGMLTLYKGAWQSPRHASSCLRGPVQCLQSLMH